MAAALRGVGRLLRNPSLFNAAHRRQLPLRLSFDRGVASKVFVGGLSFYTTDEMLAGAFSPFGQVIEASIIMDKISERSKGFGFVTFASEGEAEKAIKEMNGKILNGRVIFVDNAKPRTPFQESVPIARGPPTKNN
ncbi:unnamed protein product [Victoria cruziana]